MIDEEPKQMDDDIFSEAKGSGSKELKMKKPKKDSDTKELYFGGAVE